METISKQRLDDIHDDLAERYPEYEEALDLYQAYIHFEFKQKQLNK